jgi:hypothetical protein
MRPKLLMLSMQATIAAAIVRAFLRAGIPAAQLGVICLYRAQASLIAQKLAAAAASEEDAAAVGAAAVQTATVDSFQVRGVCHIEFGAVVVRPRSPGLLMAEQRLCFGPTKAAAGSANAMQAATARLFRYGMTCCNCLQPAKKELCCTAASGHCHINDEATMAGTACRLLYYWLWHGHVTDGVAPIGCVCYLP